MSENKHDIEEEKSRIEQLKLKNSEKDTRVKTEDVTNTKGMTFEDFGLDENLNLAIYEMGYEKPSPIQEEAIPLIMEGKNIIGKAKTGTGKTGAYAIPAISMIDKDDTNVQVLVIVPTRELALQTSATMKKFSAYLDLEIMSSLGGTSIKEDILRLENTVHIIVATPGRILDLAEKGVVDLSTVKIAILDEVDKLLSTHFRPVTEQLFEYFKEDVQTLLFSATFPKESTMEFQKKYIPNPKYINLMVHDEITLKGVTQYYAYIEEKEKLHCLNTLFSKLQINQCIIFCYSVKRVELLAKKISQLGYSCFYIHSKMAMNDRKKVFHDFKNGDSRCLVCSDLFTRGIDIPSVNVVINFDFPQYSDTYLHRIGRSGRFGHLGLAINFITDKDKVNMFKIEKELKTKINAIPQDIDLDLYTI
jgi:ATP-dependent RNA helicase DDX6/DHH1